MPPFDFRSPYLRRPWRRVVNSSGETIPPFAVMRVVSVTVTDGELVTTVAKPDTTFTSTYLVNGPLAIASSSTAGGWATTLAEGGLVLYGTGSPTLGEEWGPEQGTWTLKRYRYGFKIEGGTQTYGANLAVVARQFEVKRVLAKANGAIAADGSSGTAHVYDLNQADTSMDVTCVNRTGLAWDDATWGEVMIGTPNFGLPWECPA